MLKYVNFDIVFQEIPDEVTMAVNISNCPNRCPGCHSSWLQTDIGDPLTTDSLDTLMNPYLNGITCVCFMGGDGEPGDVALLAAHVKDLYPCEPDLDHAGLKVGWYSGNSNLPTGFDLTNFDFVKLGPYIEGLGGLKSPKTNQKLFRIHPITAEIEDNADTDQLSPDRKFIMRRIAIPKSFL